MFKKRLKGLLAMLLAGSIALSSLPMSASAQINGTIELKTANNTFEIPVYDGLGEVTNQKISVTQTNTDSALKDLNGAALKGKYVLVYDETQYNNNSKYIINKDELWRVLEDVAAAEMEPDGVLCRLFAHGFPAESGKLHAYLLPCGGVFQTFVIQLHDPVPFRTQFFASFTMASYRPLR